ncbi:protein of unknown function [Nitratireductor aquimarinus]
MCSFARISWLRHILTGDKRPRITGPELHLFFLNTLLFACVEHQQNEKHIFLALIGH